MALYVVRLEKPVKAGAKGIYDMIGNPLVADAPAGRRVRMSKEDALKAAQAGYVVMLSPDGIRELKDLPSEEPPKRVYKTRQQKADVDD